MDNLQQILQPVSSIPLTIQASPPSVPAYTCTSSFGPFTTTPPTGQNPNPPSQTYSLTFASKEVVCKLSFGFSV